MNWTTEDTARALEIWRRYQVEHDVCQLTGQTAGIDPASGRVWFGPTAADIARQMDETGCRVPFYAVRVGADYYLRKRERMIQGARCM